MRPLSQRKNYLIISDWIKAIGNHLFRCCSNCDGDAETLVQMWKSLLFHVTDEHDFATRVTINNILSAVTQKEVDR